MPRRFRLGHHRARPLAARVMLGVFASLALAVIASAAVAAPAPASPPRAMVSSAALTFDAPGDTRRLTLRNDGGSPLRVRAVRVLAPSASAAAASGPDFIV